MPKVWSQVQCNEGGRVGGRESGRVGGREGGRRDERERERERERSIWFPIYTNLDHVSFVGRDLRC